MVCRNGRGRHDVPLLYLFMVGFLSLAGLLSCSLPVQTFGAKKTDLTLRFLVLGGQAGSRSLDSRLLLPTAKTITVTLEPKGSNLSPLQTITNPLENNPLEPTLVAARFTGILYGTYLVKAEAYDAAGQPLFRQSAEIKVAETSSNFLLDLLPVVFDASALLSSIAAQAVTKTLEAGVTATWKVPAEAVIAGKYRLNVNLAAGSPLEVYAQSLDGELLNKDKKAVFAQEIIVGSASVSYLTLYNTGAEPLFVRFVVNGLTLTYDANGATSGTVPVDQNVYIKDEVVPVKGNDGTLVKTGYSFAGWNTAADGSGTDYAVSASYTANAALTLYAKWLSTAAVTISLNNPANPSITFTGGSLILSRTGTGYDSFMSIETTGGTYTYYEWVIDGPVVKPTFDSANLANVTILAGSTTELAGYTVTLYFGNGSREYSASFQFAVVE